MTTRGNANLPTPPHSEVVAVLDFGSQYTQLIARRVREAGAFSILVAPTIAPDELRKLAPKGIILSGGPASVNEANAPKCDPAIFSMGIPILAICYGMQLACQALGGGVEKAHAREFGRAKLRISDNRTLFKSLPAQTTVWMSHGDQVTNVGPNFEALAETPTCKFAAVRHTSKPIFGVQFHPEVTHTPHGTDILRNFLYEVCKCTGTWRMTDFLITECERVRQRVGNDRVICGLSGGVDSSVVAALLAKAIGPQLTCIFVDNGLLRKNERELVETTFRDHFDIDLRVVDASREFLADLKGITDPQEKRKRIGHRFIDVFKNAAAELEVASLSERCESEQSKVASLSERCESEQSKVASLSERCESERLSESRPLRVNSPQANTALINSPATTPVPHLRISSFVGRDPFPKQAPVATDIEGYIRNLPHIELTGATYFLTWRTRDDIQLSEDERDVVLDSILHWHGERMEVYAACVMNDHVHALIRPFEEWSVGSLVGGIKKFTAREIQQKRGHAGSFWLDERFDHIVRDESWLAQFVYYVLRNPVRGGLVERPSEYRWSVVHPEICEVGGGCMALPVQRASETNTAQRAVPPHRSETCAATGSATFRFLAQGTLYPDVIESGHGHAGTAANIKLHHNVGGLPAELGFELIEPLRELFKDEVRKLGEVLGLPESIVWRHPFPGPGLAVRVLGEVTEPKLATLRDCDEILLEEIIANNLYRSTNQTFAVLLPIQAVGVMGDGRSYESVVAVRAVETQDFMTADWARIPYDVLATISNRIINEVPGVNRVVYDISSKPPATIEWE